MDWETALDASGIGIVLLLTLLGALALVLPGRLDSEIARRLGLGRHVEALLILAFASTVYLSGFGNIPVYIDRNGVVAFSLVGAVIPAVLSIRFLWHAQARGLLAIIGVALASGVSYIVSSPQPELGIVARYPFFLLPSLVAAATATLLAPRSVRAVPLAYACGSMGALIGGDLVRFQWVVRTEKAIAGSFGGAEFFDLVFLAGLWAAAFAALPLLPYWSRLRRSHPEWEEVTRMAHEGRFEEAIRRAVALVNERLSSWARERGLADRPKREVRQHSYAQPVLDQAKQALRLGAAVPPEDARNLLERLGALDRRLRRHVTPIPAASGQRLLAAVIDLLPVLALAILAYALAPEPAPPTDANAGLEGAPRIFFAFSTAMSAHLLLPFLTEWLFGGATLGKAMLGLRVRRLDGAAPTGWDALVRNLGRLLDLPLLYLIAFASPEYAGRQRLGDYFAGTVVVSASATSTPLTTRPVTMPTAPIQATERMRRAPLWPGAPRSRTPNRERK